LECEEPFQGDVDPHVPLERVHESTDGPQPDGLTNSRRPTRYSPVARSDRRWLFMKVGIVGARRVGTACAFAMALRGSARELVLVNRRHERARGTIGDLQYGAILAPIVSLRAGDYDELRGAAVVMPF
jgi:hypothetical protein